MRIFEALVAVNPDWPAEARFKLAGSDTLVRVHLRGLRPPVKTTRLDWPVRPCLGLPYLKKEVVSSWRTYVCDALLTHL